MPGVVYLSWFVFSSDTEMCEMLDVKLLTFYLYWQDYFVFNGTNVAELFTNGYSFTTSYNNHISDLYRTCHIKMRWVEIMRCYGVSLLHFNLVKTYA